MIPATASTTHSIAARKRILIGLLAAILVGGAVRFYLAWTASVIARDGVMYVAMARRMVTDWRAEIPRDYPLGYPFLIRCTHAAVGSFLSADPIIAWQRSGQIVSIAFGIACIPLVFWLGRQIMGTRCGLLAAWIWALLPQAASLSADALTDMPHLTLVLAALALAMIGFGKRQARLPHAHSEPGAQAMGRALPPPAHSAPLSELSLPALFGAGLLSGAAYTMRTEGAEVAVVAFVLTLLRPRLAFSRRLAALGAIVLGFTILGGSYVLLEGGRVINKQNWYQEASQTSSPGLAQVADATGLATVAKAAATLITKLLQSLNGVWFVLGAVYPFLPSRRRLRDGARLPFALWLLHIIVLFWLYRRAGYISSRHLLLLNVGFVILASGTLAWAARRLARRKGLFFRNADAVCVAVIGLALTPWLLRDIGLGRWYVRDAGRWIAQRSAGQPTPIIIATDGWSPFYAGALNWGICRAAKDLRTMPELAGAELLVLGPNDPVPPLVRLDRSGRDIELTERVRFVEPDGKRGLVIYSVQPLAVSP